MTIQNLITEYKPRFNSYQEHENFVKEFNTFFNLEDTYEDGKIKRACYDIRDVSEYDSFIQSNFYINNKNKFRIFCTTETTINYKNNPSRIVLHTLYTRDNDSHLNGQRGILEQRTKTLYNAVFETFIERDFKFSHFKNGYVFSRQFEGLKIIKIN